MNKILIISLGAVLGLSTGWRLAKRAPAPSPTEGVAQHTLGGSAAVTNSRPDAGQQEGSSHDETRSASQPKRAQPSAPAVELQLYKEDEWIQMPAKALEVAEIGDLGSMLVKPHSQGTERRLLAELLRVSPAEVESLFGVIEASNQLWAEKASAAYKLVSPGVLQVDLDEATRKGLDAQLIQQAREVLPAEAAYVFEAVSSKLRERLYGGGRFQVSFDKENASWNVSYPDGRGKTFSSDSLDQAAPLRKLIEKVWPEALISR